MKRKILLLIVLIPSILIICLSVSGEVRVEEIEMSIPTYATGPDDPSPPLWNLRVYPYPMQTDITRKKITGKYRVVVMENDYIQLLILPDVGGRILAAIDKTNDNFDFIYHNQVMKPGLAALRGAWLSGGIEWNFPTLGHTVNTFSPVNYKILKHPDGSITCVVGTEEWVRRMKWEVFISIFPDRSYFKTRIRLYNRTLTHNNGYFWANAIISAEPQEITTAPTITKKITGQLIMLRDMRVRGKSSGRGEQLPAELSGKIFLRMKMASTLKSRQVDFSLRATPGFSSPILSRNGMSGGIR
jgi:hypothetical protein